MLKRVIVFGAHSYIGFGLCERLLSEGIDIRANLLKPNNSINKQLLEERLMMVGRNALFQINECYDKADVDDKKVDMIIHCCEDGDEPTLLDQDRLNLMNSVELAKELNVPYVFISSRNNSRKGLNKKHTKFCEEYLDDKLKTRTIFQLPSLFGPFQPPTERIHQFLVNHVNNQEKVLVIDEPLLYIQDAVDAIWDLLGGCKIGKTYSFLSEVKNGEETPFSLDLQMNTDNSQDDRSEKYIIKDPTPIGEGLKAQVAFIEKYREILNV